jgi:hypothetical protein
MVGPSTLRALSNRAFGAANWLEMWARLLQEEMKKQNVEFQSAERDRSSGWPIDGEETVTLKRRDLRTLIAQMYQQRAELLRYAERPKKSMRRSPSGFTP